MIVQEKELVLAELDSDEALELVRECDAESVSMSDKIESILRLYFSSRGDNHQGGGV